jgi:hypothetical protein
MLSKKFIINEVNKQEICKSISKSLNNIKEEGIEIDYTKPVVVVITKIEIEETDVCSSYNNKRTGNLVRYIPSGGSNSPIFSSLKGGGCTIGLNPKSNVRSIHTNPLSLCKKPERGGGGLITVVLRRP